jgi:hypothetical protein
MAGTLLAGTIVANTINTDTGIFQTNNAYLGFAKAWVNFVGSSGAINGSFNVSSVTVNSAANYTINFTTAMTNANYCPQLTVSYTSITSFFAPTVVSSGQTTTSSNVGTYSATPTNLNAVYFGV